MTCNYNDEFSTLSNVLNEHLATAEGVGIITGPSHAVRWRHAIDNEIFPPAFSETHFIGEGGYPNWNKTIFLKVLNQHRVGTPIFYILPDFRFGNSLVDRDDLVCGQFYDDNTHIDKNLINDNFDLIMYRQFVENLIIWRAVFGDDLHFFNWTSLMTAVLHIQEKRFLSAGKYDHPLYLQWENTDRRRLNAIAHKIPKIVLQIPRLQRLFIDRSLHPSPTGYFLLHLMVHGASFAAALARGEEILVKWFNALLVLINQRVENLPPLLIFGDSVWINYALKVFTPEMLQQLSVNGIEISQNHHPCSLSISVTDAIDLATPTATVNEIPIRWLVFTRQLIAKRHPSNAHLAIFSSDCEIANVSVEAGGTWLSTVFMLPNANSFVDAGDDGTPTLAGLGIGLLTFIDDLIKHKAT